MSGHDSLSRLCEAALAIARKSWPVFPCEVHGKKPLCEHGLKDASTNAETIRVWWTRWPDANIGTPTGERIVLDVDAWEGERSLQELEARHGKLPVTLTARTGKGRHLYFTPSGTAIRNSTSKLGPHLDIRGEGGYVILPPSVHASGTQYQWAVRTKPVPLPSWVAELLAEPERKQASDNGAAHKIPQGKRNSHLISLAGSMRRRGMRQSAIEAALLAENKLCCDPPLAGAEVKAIAASGSRYEPAKTETLNPWDAAETLDKFLETGEDGADFLDTEKRILARAAVTEIFSPRGLGKSLYALWLAVSFARRGLRVLLIDRDNPRHVVRSRLKSFGAEPATPGMKVISREKCPPLTNAGAWALFPYSEYDVVILDSFDAAAEGIGEQDSGRPSRALAPLLDIARREDGPAVLVLGNCVRTGKHSRGSGVTEDRADIVYEVRDATAFHPTGSKPWFEELPIVGAEGWAGRASRRKQREKFRLAFVASKFRIGVEPEPFVIEIDLASEPWTVRDITGEVDAEGAAEREQRAREHADKITKARAALEAEILRRASAGEPFMLKDRDAIPFLAAKPHGLKRNDARDVVNAPDGRWILSRIEGPKGQPIGLLPPRKNSDSGGNTPVTEPARTQADHDADFRRMHEQRSAEIDHSQTSMNTTSTEGGISAKTPTFSAGEDVEIL